MTNLEKLELRFDGPIPKHLKDEALRQDRIEEAKNVLNNPFSTDQQKEIARQFLEQLL